MTSPDDELHDEGPFQLPLLGLYADLELGAGSVHLPDEFGACAPAVRLGILTAWLDGLQRLHRQAADDLRLQLQAASPALEAEALDALWRRACAEAGWVPPAA